MLPVRVTASVGVLLHLVWLAGVGSIVGVGLTVMVKKADVPAQPLAVGVTSIILVIGELPGLFAVNEPILPVPVADNPIIAAEFVQL